MNFFDKLGLIFKKSFSSFLSIEIIIIFLLLFLFLLFNLNYKRKTVYWFLTSLLCYFLFSFLILFSKEFLLALREILKKIIEYFYFSPVPIYFLTILISSFCFLRTMFTTKYTKRHKLISYCLLLPIFYFFTLFVVECYEKQIPIQQLTSIYQDHFLLSLLQMSQSFFFLYLGICFLRYLYHYARERL